MIIVDKIYVNESSENKILIWIKMLPGPLYRDLT